VTVAPTPEIVLIAALAEQNRVIGRDGELPWHIPDDLRRFKELTVGHPVLMGRKTFESIVRSLGKPLPDRRSVVLTSRSSLDGVPTHPPGDSPGSSGSSAVEIHGSLTEAMEALADEEVVFVAGGESVYRQTLPMADRLELTLVEGEWEGDARFPPWEHLVGTELEVTNEERGKGCRFVTLKRRAGA